MIKLDFDISEIANIVTNIANPEKDAFNYLASNISKWKNEKFFLKKDERMVTRMLFHDDIIVMKAISPKERYMEPFYDFEYKKWVIKIVFEENYENNLTNIMAANIFNNLFTFILRIYDFPYKDKIQYIWGINLLSVKYVLDNVEDLDLLPFLKELGLEDAYDFIEDSKDIIKENSYEFLMNLAYIG